LIVGLGAQPLGLAGRTAHSPFGAFGAAGGPGQCELALGGALRLGVREPAAVPVGGELGELVHGGHLLSRQWWALSLAPLSRAGAGGHHT
jgi:hypothetical protein